MQTVRMDITSSVLKATSPRPLAIFRICADLSHVQCRTGTTDCARHVTWRRLRISSVIVLRSKSHLLFAVSGTPSAANRRHTSTLPWSYKRHSYFRSTHRFIACHIGKRFKNCGHVSNSIPTPYRNSNAKARRVARSCWSTRCVRYFYAI